MENNAQGVYAWFLPGETTQATFDDHLDFYPINIAGETSWAESTRGASPVPSQAPASSTSNQYGPASMSETLYSLGNFGRTAKKTKAQLAQGPLASFWSAAGNTFHSKTTSEAWELPQHKPRHTHSTDQQSDDHPIYTHRHSRSSTHPNHDAPSIYAPKSGHPIQDRIVITNFRVCSLWRSRFGHYTIRCQVALGSVATMTLQEHKIVLTLKFDSPQYIIAQRQDGPPAIGETMSTLRRLVFGEDMQTRFPFQMGHAMLEQQHRTLAGWTRNQSKARLQTAEEIITLSPRISSKRHSKHNRHENLPDELHDIQALGWTGGYDVHHEFQRLKFDPSLWSVTHINADFELSPTYPEQFIMPNSFLDPDETTKFSDHTNKTLSSPRYSADNLGPPKHSSFENPSACIRQLTVFRQNRRFPIVCWKSPAAGLVLMRSSQPMVGILGARGHEDELYIRTVLNTAAKEGHRTHFLTKTVPPKLCIMDARAFTSAMANGYAGGGCERADYYPNATISWMSLANIHTIASSHRALLKAVSNQSESTGWFGLIESTGWLNHTTELLKAASGREGIVGKMLEGNSSVLVHCTDGWDRTTQLVSLAQILLDPYYRTIHGLRVLIEKEWLSCGHPFLSRTSASSNRKHGLPSPADEESPEPWRSSTSVIHSSPNGARESISYARKSRRPMLPDAEPKLDPKPIPSFSYHMESRPSPADMPGPYMPPTETSPPQQPKQMAAVTVPISPSPIFLLFLTCLHHIVQQHPNRFEYNDYLLVLLARAAGGFSPFGDFLYNNEKERAQDRLRQRTPSIWKWIQENQGWFTNRDYASGTNPASKHPDAWRANVLHIQTGGRFSSLWSEYYFNTTPVWFPDPRSVLSTASTFAECNLNQPLLSLRRQLVLSADPFYASQFDQHQIQQLAFPGLSTNPTQQHPLCNDRRSTVMTIPPSLALLEGQDMHLYYLLVQRLRDRRKERLQQAFLNWKSWAKRRREEKPAREAGWRLMSGVSGSNSSQDDSLVDGPYDGEDFGGESEDEDFTLSSRRCAPELKVVVAAKGIEAAMERMLEGRPFFGEGSLVYDDQDSDNEMFFTREGAIRGSASGKDRDLAMLDEDGLEGAFDDFGFPVNTDDSEVVVV